MELEPVRGRSAGILPATTVCVGTVLAAVLVGGLVDAFLANQLIEAAPSAFLAHAVAAQCGLLAMTLAVLAVRPPLAQPLLSARSPGLAIVMGIGSALGINAAGSWLMDLTGESYLGLPAFEGAGWNFAIVIVAGVAAPWIEELFFREAVLVRLLATVPRGYALALSSIAFGALHLPAGGLVLFTTMTALGAVFGWLRLSTNSLTPAVAAHAANNLIALFIAWWMGPGPESP